MPLQEFYKDEWIPVILPHDRDASAPSPVEIARLFQEALGLGVDHIIRGRKIGRDVDLANLEKAAASLGTALCADLARALEADTCEAIEGAIKRGRGADLPKRLVAQKRLCELQLHRALATGDEADLTMALREASRLGGDDAANFENFAAVKQKLAHLRMKRLQQQSLDVIKGDGKERRGNPSWPDLDSVMAVINVALRRSDWDRDWDQIWLEVLQEGRAQVKKMIDTAKASGQHEKVAQIFRLAEKYGLRNLEVPEDSLQMDTIQANRQDMKVLLQLCSAANTWGCKSFLSDAEEPLRAQAAELEKKWDKGGAGIARLHFENLNKELTPKKRENGKDQVQEHLTSAVAREERLQQEAEKGKGTKAHELEMEVIQNVMGAMHDAKLWGWKKLTQKGERLLKKQVQTVLEEHELKQASPKLEEMLKAAQQHQVRESLTPILDNCLQDTKKAKKGDECQEAIKTLGMEIRDPHESMIQKFKRHGFRGSEIRLKSHTFQEMKLEIEKMKSKEKGAEGEAQLRSFQDEAQSSGDSLAVELASASLAHIEERVLQTISVSDRELLKKLLDGLVRHWDLKSCAGLAKNTAATGHQAAGEEVAAGRGEAVPAADEGVQRVQRNWAGFRDCLTTQEGLQAVDVDVLQGVKLENSKMSNSVLLVREQELQLFEHCLRWSAARVDVLQQTMAGSQPKGAKAASRGKKTMEELSGGRRPAEGKECERKKKEELQQLLQAEERLELIDADPENTVKCVMVAEESGWKERSDGHPELSKQASELYKRRVKEAKEISTAKSNDEAIHGFRFMVRVMHSAQSMRGAEHSRIAVSAKKQAWCTDVEDVHKKVQELVAKIMEQWEESPEAAPQDPNLGQDVSALHASVVELSKVSKDLETYSQQMQHLMKADEDMLAAIKDSEDHPTDVAKALEALKVVTARSPSNPFQKKVEKMLSRTFEEAKQSGDRKQLELLRDTDLHCARN
eukprot:s1042_g4.t2